MCSLVTNQYPPCNLPCLRPRRQTQEVDNGDALGHDFGPVASLLAAPVGWPAAADAGHLWSRLFCAARAAAELVPTAPSNALAAELGGGARRRRSRSRARRSTSG